MFGVCSLTDKKRAKYLMGFVISFSFHVYISMLMVAIAPGAGPVAEAIETVRRIFSSASILA